MELETAVGKIFEKIEGKATLLGGIYALLADPMADGRGLTGMPQFIMDRLTHFNLSSVAKYFDHLMWAIQNPGKYPITPGLAASILGWAAEELGGDFHPIIKRLGKFTKNLGIGMILGSLLAVFLWMGVFDPPNGTPQTSSTSTYVYK
jgi:hypothetical protein